MQDPAARGVPAFDPRDFGAKGDGATKDTQPVQQAIASCAAAGGGTVYLAPGRYLIAPINLRSNVTLYLEAGAVLLGSRDRADYGVVERRYAGTTQLCLEALINAEDAEHITITGRGVIDGQGSAFWQPIRDYYATPKGERPPMEVKGAAEEIVRQSIWHRPRLVEPVRCRDVLIEGVTLQNSGFWNLHLLYCEQVTLHAVTFLNPPEGCNNDGIDLDSCRNVTISDCDLSVGDDCICLKSGWDEDGRRVGIPTENVTVTNCITRAGHGGIVIGSDMSGGVRNVVVSNCCFVGTDIGVRLKTMRGRGGVVENLTVSNVIMDGVPQALVINMHYWKKTQPEPVSERTPRFRNIRLSHIDAVNCGAAGFIHGLEEMPVENVRLDGVRIQSRKPFWCRHARGLEFRNVRMECDEAPELHFEDVEDLEIDRFQARSSRAPAPPIRLTRVRQASIHGSSAVNSGGELVALEDTPAGEVRLANNDAR